MPSQKDINEQEQLLAIYRRNLAQFLRQQAQMGGSTFVLPSIVNGIIETRDDIGRIKGILRQWGVHVIDHPDDKMEVNSNDTPMPNATPHRLQSDTKPSSKTNITPKPVVQSQHDLTWSAEIKEPNTLNKIMDSIRIGTEIGKAHRQKAFGFDTPLRGILTVIFWISVGVFIYVAYLGFTGGLS